MPENLYLVFSKPPERVSAEEYDRWYHAHVRENIETPGFLSSMRYALDPGTRPLPGGFSHLAMYEYAGEYAPIAKGLEQRIAAGEIVLPEWFGEIGFGAVGCRPIDERAEPVRH